MYFPYLRGRQYELLALKELVQKNLLGNSVCPVVEPVKISSTLLSTVDCYTKTFKVFALVLNPEVVSLDDKESQELLSLVKNSEIIPAVIANETLKKTIAKLENEGYEKSNVMVVFNSEEAVPSFEECFSGVLPLFTLMPYKRDFRHLVSDNKVLFEDYFHKQQKNADYLKKLDELFSKDHLYYKEERYSGFGDYSIIGEEYDESGFAPRAVAIHIVYFDHYKELRVHHFVSNTNHGIEDVAGKFYEAIKKMEGFIPLFEDINQSYGLSTLLSYAKSGYYPGLPTLKKLSIMHHLELMGKYLDGRI